MKTTLELPDKLMRQIKVRAAKNGKKLKDVIAELLEKGLEVSRQSSQPVRRPAIQVDPKTGLPYLQCAEGAPGRSLTAAQTVALEQQAQLEEDLERLGVPLR